jgi:hypothetical protein
MKKVILTIFAIFNIIISMNAQDKREFINSSFSISRKIDVVKFEDGNIYEFENREEAIAKIDVTNIENYISNVKITVVYKGKEIKQKTINNVCVIRITSKGQVHYFFQDEYFCHGALWHNNNKFICSLYTVEIN